jgi:hypothetical protein
MHTSNLNNKNFSPFVTALKKEVTPVRSPIKEENL